MTDTTSTLLIIAGFECNGFAGLLKDVEVANSLNTHVSAIATTLTAQNQYAMSANQPTPAAVVSAQLAALTELPSIVKIGVLPNAQIAELISQWLDSLGRRKPTVVLDPVTLSSSDRSAFSVQPIADIISPLLPFVDVITPNLEEYCALIGSTDLNWNHRTAYQQFNAIFPGFNGDLIVKSAVKDPAKNTVTDALLTRSNPSRLLAGSQSVSTQTLRGTGCVYSTALACALLQNYTVESAMVLASAYLSALRESQVQPNLSVATKRLANWPYTSTHYPIVHSNITPTFDRAFPALDIKKGLYPIVDSADWIQKLALWGVTTLQLRLKNLPLTDLESEIQRSVEIAKQYQLQLFINDYWQLAIKYGAYGVHLGQEDLQTANLNKIYQAGLRLGISTHGDYEFLLAKQLQPSYCAVGAIFPTKTKDMSGKIQGLDRLQRYCNLAGNIPIVAIGGITLENIESVMSQKPDFIALVSAITQAQDSQTSTELLLTHTKVL